jgi:protein-L-isoaspartate(D-aspartate) O-methyltransferase
MLDLALRRRFFAEEIEATANLRTQAIVEALATVPRERFLPPGPWQVRSEADFGAPPRQTPDADPRHVYHNYSVAIDPTRTLYNGAPGLIAMWLDAVAIRPGARVLHIGCGTGYYTAVMAHVVGASGRVLAVEVDEGLAATARVHLASSPWVEVQQGDGREIGGDAFDAIVVNAGVSHPLPVWLDALSPGGRLIAPLTVPMPMMGATIGKGIVVLVTNDGGTLGARVVTFVAIYTAVGLRDEAMAARLGEAMRRSPFPQLKRLRRDSHDVAETCWLHGDGFCLGS